MHGASWWIIYSAIIKTFCPTLYDHLLIFHSKLLQKAQTDTGKIKVSNLLAWLQHKTFQKKKNSIISRKRRSAHSEALCRHKPIGFFGFTISHLVLFSLFFLYLFSYLEWKGKTQKKKKKKEIEWITRWRNILFVQVVNILKYFWDEIYISLSLWDQMDENWEGLAVIDEV